MRQLVVEDDEKNRILKLYGLLNESTDSEVLNFYSNYIGQTDCREIASDLENFQKQPEYQKLSNDEKETLENAIKGLKVPGLGVQVLRNRGYVIDKSCGPLQSYQKNCPCLKKFMEEELKKNFQQEKENLKTRACVLSKMKNLNLSFCSQKIEEPKPQEDKKPLQTQPSTPKDTPTINQPTSQVSKKTVPDSVYSKTDKQIFRVPSYTSIGSPK